MRHVAEPRGLQRLTGAAADHRRRDEPTAQSRRPLGEPLGV